MLSQALSNLAMRYSSESQKPFGGSTFAKHVRAELTREASNLIRDTPFDLQVEASVGRGNWAAVPWLAFFDPLITTSATKGYYVVYLINPATKKIFLSLNQGTTEVLEEFKTKEGKEVLRRRARDMRARVSDISDPFNDTPINLGSKLALPVGYTSGHALGKSYDAHLFSETELVGDLTKMLSIYDTLIARGGITPLEVMKEEANSDSIEETRRYTLSRKIERSPGIRNELFKFKQAKCECCGLEPSLHYGYFGPDEQAPLDVHHAKPLHSLAEGETKRYSIPDDFMILCPTCHRMIHKQKDPSNLQLLKSKVRFHFALTDEYPLL